MAGRPFAILALTTVWAFTACLLGPALGAYFFAIADLGSPPSLLTVDWADLPARFDLSYKACLAGLMINTAIVIPLSGVLFFYAEIACKWPRLERSWAALSSSMAIVAALCSVGALLPARAILGVYTGLVPMFVFPFALTALVLSRWLVPGLELDAFRHSDACVKGLRSTGQVALRVFLIVTVLTASTALVTSELRLPCVDAGETCFEVVSSRGLPYPFIQRAFLPSVFICDVLILALPAVFAVRVVWWRRAVAQRVSGLRR